MGERAGPFIHLQRVADPLRLRLLIEVGARGSISAAAEACSIGQPSASLHLRHLEAAVGCQLVKRGAAGSRLTPEGEVVRLHATRMLAALDAMLDELKAQQAGTRGTLTVAASSAASYLLPSALRRFAERHPEVKVTARVDNSAGVHRLVRRSEVAFGIAGPVPGSTGVDCEHLLDDEVVGIAAPGLIGALGADGPARRPGSPHAARTALRLGTTARRRPRARRPAAGPRAHDSGGRLGRSAEADGAPGAGCRIHLASCPSRRDCAR